jgi:hypothetical protein
MDEERSKSGVVGMTLGRCVDLFLLWLTWTVIALFSRARCSLYDWGICKKQWKHYVWTVIVLDSLDRSR